MAYRATQAEPAQAAAQLVAAVALLMGRYSLVGTQGVLPEAPKNGD